MALPELLNPRDSQPLAAHSASMEVPTLQPRQEPSGEGDELRLLANKAARFRFRDLAASLSANISHFHYLYPCLPPTTT